MGKTVGVKKVLNPRLRAPFYATIFVGVIFILLLISHNSLVVGALGGAISGGLAVLVAFGISAIIAQMKGIDMYVPRAGSVAQSEHKDTKSDLKQDKPTGNVHPHRTAWIISSIILGAVILVGGSGFLFVFLMNKVEGKKTEIPSFVMNIKDALADEDVAKQKVDNHSSSHFSSSDLRDIDGTAALGTTTVGVTIPYDVYPFADSVSKWGKQIIESAGSSKWKDVPDDPPSFKISLTAKDASDSYDDTLNNIDQYKVFGDYAIAKGNQDEMTWIAARLHAEEIYLDALSNATITQGPSTDVAYATTYGASCYYGRGHTLFYSDRIKKGDCAKKLKDAIDPIRKAAKHFSTDKAKDPKDWTVAWDALKNIGYPVSTTGAKVANDGTVTPPPQILAFQAACKAKGGDTPAGLAMNNLPTSESGLICKFKGPKGGTCWDFLTDSGNPYAGGDGDCPKLNLQPPGAVAVQVNIPDATPVPVVKKVEETSQPDTSQNQTQEQTKQYPFDGSYGTTPSISCSTPNDSTSLNSDITGFMTSFTVRQSKVYYSGWYTNNVAEPPPNPTIDSSGNVSTSYTDNGGGATEHTEYIAHFDASGSVSGNLTGYWMFGNGPRTDCSGSFSGSRSGG